MKLFMYLGACMFLCACSASVDKSHGLPFTNTSDAGSTENGDDAIKYPFGDADLGDVSDDSDVDSSCKNEVTKPTSYPRLLERDCTDSTGSQYLKDYWDTELSLGCQWNTTVDLKTRCIPENEQTAPLYADSLCLTPIALSLNGSPPYIGLDTH